MRRKEAGYLGRNRKEDCGMRKYAQRGRVSVEEKASQQAVKIEGEGMFTRVYKIGGQFGYCIEHLPIFHTPGCVGGGVTG